MTTTNAQNKFLATVNPELRKKFTKVIEACSLKGVSITIHSSYRSTAHQTRLWNNRKNNSNPVARPGLSPHEWGVAIDATPVPRTAGAWKVLYDTAEKAGLVLGVKFRRTDPPHFELPGFVHGSKKQKWPKPTEKINDTFFAYAGNVIAQPLLVKLGKLAAASATGQDNPATQAAVKTFQLAYKITPADGKAGPATLPLIKWAANNH